jgi:hypothetical protein
MPTARRTVARLLELPLLALAAAVAAGCEPRGSAESPPSAAAADTVAADQHAGHVTPAPDNAASDSAFARLQERGRTAMGVDQYTSRHVFERLPDGGRIVLRRDPADTAGARTIRAHLREVSAAFARGDFATPGFVHGGEVPGTRVMGERRGRIGWEVRDLPGGGEIRITTSDAEALRAVHAFLEYQGRDHRAGHGA